MDQQQLDSLADALRAQGLTWAQTNFAVSLVRNAHATRDEKARAALRVLAAAVPNCVATYRTANARKMVGAALQDAEAALRA